MRLLLLFSLCHKDEGAHEVVLLLDRILISRPLLNIAQLLFHY